MEAIISQNEKQTVFVVSVYNNAGEKITTANYSKEEYDLEFTNFATIIRRKGEKNITFRIPISYSTILL